LTATSSNVRFPVARWWATAASMRWPMLHNSWLTQPVSSRLFGEQRAQRRLLRPRARERCCREQRRVQRGHARGRPGVSGRARVVAHRAGWLRAPVSALPSLTKPSVRSVTGRFPLARRFSVPAASHPK
jgi:hypothetical protein